jgi:hypothetical protein
MNRLAVSFVAVLMLAGLPAAALATWADDFDSYATDISLHGVGGWKGWDNDPTWTAYTRDEYALSVPNSVEIAGNSDLIHEYTGYTSGQWTYTAWQYVPEDFVGESYFIMQNTYNDGGPYNWSTQIRFDSALGVVESEFEAVQLPLITGRWVEIRNEIDLDADWQEIYYDGQLLSAKSWTEGLSGGGALNIGSVDLFANGASAVYYDDMSLVPEPAAGLLLLLGVTLLRRR